MNRTLLSLCLFGAALATGNALIMQRASCPSAEARAGAAHQDRQAAKPDVASAAGPKAAGAAAEIRPANIAFWTDPSKPAKAGAMLPALPQDVETTGSVKPAAKPDRKPSDKTGAKMPGEPDLAAPAKPKPRANPYRPRRYGWRPSYRYPRPPMGFAIRVYPGW